MSWWESYFWHQTGFALSALPLRCFAMLKRAIDKRSNLGIPREQRAWFIISFFLKKPVQIRVEEQRLSVFNSIWYSPMRDRVVQLKFMPEMYQVYQSQVKSWQPPDSGPFRPTSEENICINNDMSGRDMQPSRDREPRMSSEMWIPRSAVRVLQMARDLFYT